MCRTVTRRKVTSKRLEASTDGQSKQVRGPACQGAIGLPGPMGLSSSPIEPTVGAIRQENLTFGQHSDYAD